MGSGDERIEKEFAEIKRGAVQIHSEDQLLEKLKKSRSTGVPLRIKLGADPSSSDLHIGHAVVLRKLRQFQDLGHKVILIIGDFTAMIGDPTGRSKTRPALTLEQTRRNGATYLAQATRILDPSPEKLEMVYNSEWLGAMTFKDILRLAQSYTVARMLERDDFNNRYRSGTPIGVHEFLYPLAQAYDSVAIRADVEVGGTDQLFNLLVGRDILREYGLPEQVALTMPLLAGIDGSEKMSKSLNNYIGITEAPELMFRKAMRVPDSLLYDYFELCTSLDLEQAKKDIAENAHGAHRALARELVRYYHGPDAVADAEKRYDQVAKKQIPDSIREYRVPPEEADAAGAGIGICRLLVLAGLSRSNGEARRLIEQKGVRLNGDLVTDPMLRIKLQSPLVLQKGRDSFVKVLPS